MGIDILRDVKNVRVEGFVNVRSISHFCECDLLNESCVLYSSGVILCYMRGSFPWHFIGGRFPKWTVSYLIG